MAQMSRITLGAVAAVVIGTGAAVGLGGVWPTSSDTHPPCEQLPTAAEADAALARNQLLVNDIEALGAGITVGVGRPCPRGRDRALVRVSFTSGSEHDAVAGLLARSDGFGVPVHLVEK